MNFESSTKCKTESIVAMTKFPYQSMLNIIHLNMKNYEMLVKNINTPK